jgi:hypothetical protein
VSTIKARKPENSRNLNNNKQKSKIPPKFRAAIFFMVIALISGSIGAAIAFVMSSKEP